jgi:hypothetical protein
MTVSPSRTFGVRNTDARKLDGRRRDERTMQCDGGRRVGEGNGVTSPHGRPGKDNATSVTPTEKVSAAPMCDAHGRGAAIPDLTTSNDERE